MGETRISPEEFMEKAPDDKGHILLSNDEGIYEHKNFRNEVDRIDLSSFKNIIAEYTHTGNIEINISSVNVGTNTFSTATNHGLANGTRISPMLKHNAGIFYPLNVYVGGMNHLANGFYVINATGTTFQISTTAGGTAVTLSTLATTDLTKWHFEVLGSTTSLTLNFTNPIDGSSIPCRDITVIMQGCNLLTSTNYVFPIGHNTVDYLRNDTGVYTVPNVPAVNASSPHHIVSTISINSRWLSILKWGKVLSVSTADRSRYNSANVDVFLNKRITSEPINISGISINSFNPANGYKIIVIRN